MPAHDVRRQFPGNDCFLVTMPHCTSVAISIWPIHGVEKLVQQQEGKYVLCNEPNENLSDVFLV